MSRERVAAAVILCRGSGPDLEVFLARRAPELRFFGGYLAVPGGVRDAADGPDDPADPGGPGDPGDPGGPGGRDAGPLRRCAVREIFEETGVLLDAGMRTIPAARRAALRRVMLGVDPADVDPADAARAWQEIAAAADGDVGLREICRIRTPPFAPVRYDTVFFLAHLPAGESPEIWPGELVAGFFTTPAAALSGWLRGEHLIVPPVVVLLQRLRDRDGHIDAFARDAAELAAGFQRGKLHRVWFSPGVLLAPLDTPTLPPATTTNCYVVGTQRLFVIDPGTPYAGEQRRLFELLDELQDEGAVVDSVVCTHHHPDHVGAAGAVSRRYRVPVRAHPITLARLEQDVHGTAALGDGDRIDLGRAPDGSDGWFLEAIFTPGHDRGHLAFRESRYGALIAGDMISTVATIMIDPPEGHMQTYLESLERLSRTPIQTLYPAHGPAAPDGPRIIARFIEHRRQRLARLEAALRSGADTIAGLLPKVYWDVKADMHGYAARSLLAALEMLAENGRARERDGVWELTPAADGTR